MTGGLSLGFSLSLTGNTGGGGSSLYEGQVANRCTLPNNFTNTQTQQMSRSAHKLADDIVAIKLVLPNAYIDNTTQIETLTGGTATFTAAICDFGGTTRYLATFGGLSSGQTSGHYIETDWINVTKSAGTWIWALVWRSDPNGICFGSYAQSAAPYFKDKTVLLETFNSGSSIADTTASGTPTDAGSTSNLYTPAAIVGLTRKGTVIYLGDSIANGATDTLPPTTRGPGIFSFLEQSYGTINAARQSNSVQKFLLTNTLRSRLCKYASAAILEWTITDLGFGRTVQQIEDDLVAAANLVKPLLAGPGKIYVSTAIPQTNAGNTVPSSNNANRIIINDWKRTIPAPFNGVMEMADLYENSRNGGLFINAADTTDGTHPQQSRIVAANADSRATAMLDYFKR